MTMPAFTAEAALYRMSGQYQTRRHIVDLSSHMVTPVWPALREQEGEVIHVHGCAPGYTDIGGVCWPNPLTEPPPMGGSGNGPTGGEPTDDGGGGGTGTPPKTPPKTPPNLETLGEGPSRKRLVQGGAFECIDISSDFQECHSCSDGKLGRLCGCYACQPSSDACTRWYDCTGYY